MVPEFGWFQWSSMILSRCSLEGVSSESEPIAHFVSPPPYFDYRQCSRLAVQALAQSYLHWDLAWSMGSLTTIILMKVMKRGIHSLQEHFLFRCLERLSNRMGVLNYSCGYVGPSSWTEVCNTVWTQSGVVL